MKLHEIPLICVFFFFRIFPGYPVSFVAAAPRRLRGTRRARSSRCGQDKVPTAWRTGPWNERKGALMLRKGDFTLNNWDLTWSNSENHGEFSNVFGVLKLEDTQKWGSCKGTSKNAKGFADALLAERCRAGESCRFTFQSPTFGHLPAVEPSTRYWVCVKIITHSNILQKWWSYIWKITSWFHQSSQVSCMG